MVRRHEIIHSICHGCEDKSCAAAVLEPDELDRINVNHKESTFRKGDVLVHEGSFNSHIIYLRSGLVKESIRRDGDKEQILQVVRNYSYLGLPSLFGDRVNHFSYTALNEVKVCYIDLDTFNSLVKNNRKFAYEILVSVSRDSLQNFHRFVRRWQKNTFGKVADAMLYLSVIIFDSHEFEMPLSRQELANMIGTSRESATRVLMKLKDDGILDIRGHTIRIKDPAMLEKISKIG